MEKWIYADDMLPPAYLRVLICVRSTNLFDRNGPVTIFCAELVPARVEGNNQRPYKWSAENSGNWFGQNVLKWMPLPKENNV